MVRWEKLGLIFQPKGQHSWMQTHSINPVAVPLGNNTIRVFFGTRDADNRSHVGFVTIELTRPKEILEISQTPALAPGPLGYFDDHGTMPSSIVCHPDGHLCLYYIGWNPGPRRPLYYPSIGLATSTDEGRSFERYSPAPILGRSDIDPWMVTAPFVLHDGPLWRMYYVSGLRWEETAEGLSSYYHNRYAESDDGIAWRRDGRVTLELRPGEKNIARQCVLKRDGQYHAWYSFNSGEGYRIGYARSVDGVTWQRHDGAAGIELSDSGWDSDALAYPYVFEHGGRLYMLYNGGGYGRDGFGLAVEAS